MSRRQSMCQTPKQLKQWGKMKELHRRELTEEILKTKQNKQKTLHRLNKIWTCLNRATLKYLYWKFKFYPAFYLRFILFNYTILFVMCLNDFKERYFALGSFILLLWLCINLEDHRSKYNWKLGYREKEKIFSSLGILSIGF